MPNTTPKCHYGDALGSPERIDARAERLPLPLEADRLPLGAPKARPFRTAAQSILCAARRLVCKRYGAVRGGTIEASRFSRHRNSFLPVWPRDLTIRSTSGCGYIAIPHPLPAARANRFLGIVHRVYLLTKKFGLNQNPDDLE